MVWCDVAQASPSGGYGWLGAVNINGRQGRAVPPLRGRTRGRCASAATRQLTGKVDTWGVVSIDPT